ncbi:MAG: hypothetical protein L6Q37_14690, partial [Bdellovibrionaceae bacterium]|nr:hypothetical protein [Pseudobdellovibrionaceae bacterium]
MKNLSLTLLLGLMVMSVDGYSQSLAIKKINSKTPASTASTSRATAISKQDLKPSNFSAVLSVARYYQYQLYEGKSPEQTLDFSINPVYVNQSLKFTSLFVYSHNETNPKDSSMDDAIFNLSSIPKNINSSLKGRYYLTGTAGLSKVSREEKGQYGAVGPGVGLLIDSEKLKIPWMSLA